MCGPQAWGGGGPGVVFTSRPALRSAWKACPEEYLEAVGVMVGSGLGEREGAREVGLRDP